jgi:hypothetical protein
VQRTSIRLFLAIVILLQSFAAIADVHRFHQTTSQHEAITQHEEVAPHGASTELTHAPVQRGLAEPLTNSLDCQHCCHCHGVTTSVLPPSDLNFGVSPQSTTKFNVVIQQPRKVSSSLYRPPIA